jgi:hypothetical protein
LSIVPEYSSVDAPVFPVVSIKNFIALSEAEGLPFAASSIAVSRLPFAIGYSLLNEIHHYSKSDKGDNKPSIDRTLYLYLYKDAGCGWQKSHRSGRRNAATCYTVTRLYKGHLDTSHPISRVTVQ